MTTELEPTKKARKAESSGSQGGSSGAVYGLGLIGAWAFYIGRATTTEERIRGFLKGLFWPAFLVYDALQFLHKEE